MEWVISLVEGKEKKKWRNCGQAINVMQGRRNGRTLGASAPPQCLAEQLTLSQPGGQIMPTTVLQAPSNFQTLRRPCDFR